MRWRDGDGAGEVVLAPCPGREPPEDPFRVPRPSVIGLSGGRSSAYMLRRVLDAHGGTLPDDVRVVFANTGLLHPESVDFVRACSVRWRVPVTVVEYDPAAYGSTRVVTWGAESRDGTPFSELLALRGALPGTMARYCMSELKVRRVAAYARDVLRHDAFHYVCGVRYDEPNRVEAKEHRWRTGKDGVGVGVPWMPLAKAKVTRRDVDAFWDAEGFAPDLPDADGRCDNCFLRPVVEVAGNMRRRPWTADWWVRHEAVAPRLPDGRPDAFRRDGPRYADVLAHVRDQGDMFDGTDPGADGP